jgi:cytochrome P450
MEYDSMPSRLFLYIISTSVWSTSALYYRLTGTQHYAFHALHQKYGQYVRVGPNEISVIAASAWKDVYDCRSKGARGFAKDTKNYYTKSKGGINSILTADDDAHTRMRRVFSAAFSNRALGEQEELLKAYANLFIKKLQSKVSEPKVDLVQFFNFLTFDSVADLTFGQPLHLLENMKYNSWVENFFSTAKYIAMSSALRNLNIFGKIALLALPHSVMKKLKSNIAFCRESVDRRSKSTNDAHPDFWSFVLKAEGEKALSIPEMYANSLLFMIAGTETTATALSGMVYFMLKNPAKLKILTQEIRSSFSSEADITMLALARLEYMQACILEGLRIYPPVAVGLPRMVPAHGGQIGGKPLPAGVSSWHL